MKIAVIPASAQTSRAAIRELLDHPSAPNVTGFYRDLAKVPKDFKNHPQFEAMEGDLTATAIDFTGVDAVITLTPPKYDGSDFVAFGKAAAGRIRDAAKAANVTRVVYVSSIGAQHDEGVGEVRTNHNSEMILGDSAPEVVLVRNGYFMENWIAALDTIKTGNPPHFYSTIGPLEHKLPMVSARDIGRTCAKEALGAGSSSGGGRSPRIIELHGPESYSTKDVKEAFEKVSGKELQVRLVEKNDLSKFFSTFLPEKIVPDFVEMTEAGWPGGLLESQADEGVPIYRGKDTLVSAFGRLWETATTAQGLK